MRIAIITKLALVALLTMFVCGCQKQNKTGEAFVVLKSGEVIYMADMEVVCLKPSFKNDFSGWRNEYESHDQSFVRGIETRNPTVTAKLKEIDDSIAELNAKISGMSGDEKKISDSLARAIESERDKLVAEMAKKNDVCEEYKQIVEPVDKQFNESQVEAKTIERKQKALTTESIHNINAYIIESKLTVSKLKPETVDSLFNTDAINWESRLAAYTFNSTVAKPFLVEKRPDSQLEGWYIWVFLVNIPAELEGTQLDSVIKAAYQKWKALENNLEDIYTKVRAQRTTRDEKLIPWQNRHGLPQWEGRNLVELEEQLKEKLARHDKSLSVLKAGGPEARSLVQEEVRKGIAKLNESLNPLKQQHRELLQEATENARNELKTEYKRKFYELIKRDALAAVRTGSKGDFIVSGEAAYLYAETQRDNGEKLAWLVRIDPSSLKIKMSVSNTASAGGYGEFDNFWMLRWKLD